MVWVQRLVTGDFSDCKPFFAWARCMVDAELWSRCPVCSVWVGGVNLHSEIESLEWTHYLAHLPRWSCPKCKLNIAGLVCRHCRSELVRCVRCEPLWGIMCSDCQIVSSSVEVMKPLDVSGSTSVPHTLFEEEVLPYCFS
jgi:hypothetical protein